MIPIDQLTDEQFERHALDVLQRELGAGGLARFLRLHRSGSGDYTRDRDEWQKDLTLTVLESIATAQQPGCKPIGPPHCQNSPIPSGDR
jgi:hypothetical protein